jgi:hypothetical protein
MECAGIPVSNGREQGPITVSRENEENFLFHKRRRIHWPADRLSDSQEWLRSILMLQMIQEKLPLPFAMKTSKFYEFNWLKKLPNGGFFNTVISISVYNKSKKVRISWATNSFSSTVLIRVVIYDFSNKVQGRKLVLGIEWIRQY